jgi:hypothetical protein
MNETVREARRSRIELAVSKWHARLPAESKWSAADLANLVEELMPLDDKDAAIAAVIEDFVNDQGMPLRCFRKGFAQSDLALRDRDLLRDAQDRMYDVRPKNQRATWHRELVLTVLELVGDTRGDALREAREWVQGLSDEEIPQEMREHVCAVLSRVEQDIYRTVHERLRSDRRQPPKQVRDAYIYAAVELLINAGYELSRNETTDSRESASSLVAQALAKIAVSISEKQVAAIYRRTVPG